MDLHLSLRHKITLGFYAIGMIIFVLSVYAYLQISSTSRQVIAGEHVTDLFDTSLEIRRFEKNFFLYHDAGDLDATLEYVRSAERALAAHESEFTALVPATELGELGKRLNTYAQLLREYREADAHPPSIRDALEQRVRTAGKEILAIAERLAKAERSRLTTFLHDSTRTLLIAILVLCALAVLIGRTLAHRVVRSLKQLEDNMALLAEGRYEALHVDTHERELVSLTQAFNRVLRELEVKRKHLLRSEKLAALGTLLSGAAHELNNPLSNISSSCQILLEEFDDADRNYQRTLLQQIDQETLRAQQLIRPLLDYARDKAFEPGPVPLGELVRETLHLLHPHIPARIEVAVDIADHLSVHADRNRLQQVLFNLLKNAVESIRGEGGVTVRALPHAVGPGATERRATSRDVDIEIRDTGSGIPAEVLPRVFDPFFTTKDVGKGTGLGLYIVHEIIEEHGGHITVDSTPGQGSRFLLTLPAQAAGATTSRT